jgi:hypothetical protein
VRIRERRRPCCGEVLVVRAADRRRRLSAIVPKTLAGSTVLGSIGAAKA